MAYRGINKLEETWPTPNPRPATGCSASLTEVAAFTGFYLNDARWGLIASILPGKGGDPGRRARDNRLFVEAVLWIVRTGSPWRKLPPEFGHWYTAYTRFNRWTLKNVWPEVFNKLAQDRDCKYFYESGVIVYAPARRARPCLPRLRRIATSGARTRVAGEGS